MACIINGSQCEPPLFMWFFPSIKVIIQEAHKEVKVYLPFPLNTFSHGDCMKTNAELHKELVALATALAISTDREEDIPEAVADLDKMLLDRDKLMTMWVTMHFDHVVEHGDCSKSC